MVFSGCPADVAAMIGRENIQYSQFPAELRGVSPWRGSGVPHGTAVDVVAGRLLHYGRASFQLLKRRVLAA
jgi:hypothetical protein